MAKRSNKPVARANPIEVLNEDKIKISDLSSTNSLDLDTTLIDTSVKTSGSYKSYKTSLVQFSGENNSDIPDLLDECAAERYHTVENELSAYDLYLFSKYSQEGTKKTYFNDHPEVDEECKPAELDFDQLLTKSNIIDFEDFLVTRRLNPAKGFNTYNWENESPATHITDISTITDLLTKNKWDSQATYKFEYGSRESNEIELEISGTCSYVVAGLVSVKSILPDQKSGTIYLEARPKGSTDAWETIDSAVFKFVNDATYPGTYVTLTGYLQPGFVTRLKLNLKPNGYSMNMWQFRHKGSLTNHYSNTFLGFTYELDRFTTNIPYNITFTDVNYLPYKFRPRIDFNIPDYKDNFPGEKMRYDVLCRNVIDTITRICSEAGVLKISSDQLTNANGFTLNGLRLSPCGRIYSPSDTLPLKKNCILYPSYSSGTITAQPVPTVNDVYRFDNYSWNSGRLLDDIDPTTLSVLSGLRWPLDTEVYGNIIGITEISHSIPISYTGVTGSWNSYDTVYTGEFTVTDSTKASAQYKPRVRGVSQKTIDFSKYLAGKNLVGNITCTVSANTVTTYDPGGSGTESYGRIYNGAGQILSPVTLNTKNRSAIITDGMCTGSKWNVHAHTVNIPFQQGNNVKRITIEVNADPADDDTGKTWFELKAKLNVKYKYVVRTDEYVQTSSTEVSFLTASYSTGLEINDTNFQIVPNTYAYPLISTGTIIQSTPDIPPDFVVQTMHLTASVNNPISVVPYPQNII